jgi:hypothetical protein
MAATGARAAAVWEGKEEGEGVDAGWPAMDGVGVAARREERKRETYLIPCRKK